MPVSPDHVDDLAAAVASLYREAEASLARRIARQLAEGVDAPGWATAKLAAVNDLRRAAQLVIAGLNFDNGPAIRQAVAEAYRRGEGQALADLAERFAPRSGIGAAARAARQQVPGLAAIEATADAVAGELRGLHSLILRQTTDVYRSVITATVARTLTGSQTRLQAAQAAWQALVDRGITSFRDKGGRRWQLSSYVEMAVRTVTQRAAIQGHVDSLAAAGERLVTVPDVRGECELCRPFEGKVLALHGETGKIKVEHATRDGEYVTVDVVATLEEARARGLFHPNCRHTLSVFLPGITRLQADTADPAGDRARQRQREIERQIRKWKMRQAAALDDTARAEAGAKVRAWQAAMRQHVDEHDLKRLRYREQIGAGNIPPHRGDAAGEINPPPDQGGLFPAPERPTPPPLPQRGGAGAQALPQRRPAGDQEDEAAAAPVWAREGRRAHVGELIPTEGEHGFERRGDIEDALDEVFTSDRRYAGFTAEIDTVDPEPDKLRVIFNLYNDDGLAVGVCERVFHRDIDGVLYAEHAFLRLSPAAQNCGFSEAWNGFLEDWYRESGVQHIEVHADIDVGGYTWARQGFDFQEDSDAEGILSLLREEQDKVSRGAELLERWMAGEIDEDEPDFDIARGQWGGMTAEELAPVLEGYNREILAAGDILDRADRLYFGEDDYPTAYEISQCGREPGQVGRGATWIGKRAMLGSDWMGVKPLWDG